MLAALTGLMMASTIAVVMAAEGFVDYGVGAKVAECRGVVTTETADGRCLVIANALDVGPRGYILVTDIDTRETKQYFCPDNVPQSAAFGSMLGSNGKFYTAQGKVLLEFDPQSAEWTFQGVPASTGCYLSFTEGLDGTVWAGAHGVVSLVSFDPVTKETRNHGPMDPEENYLSSLAVDKAGWVYGGIGTARYNIVAYDPKTGERRQLVKEEERTHGTGDVYPGEDGAVYGSAGGQSYRLFEGKATPIDKSEAGARRDVGNIGWGAKTGSFPDGRRLVAYNLPERWLTVQEANSDELTRIEFEFESEGVSITSLAEGPGGVIYGSTCHPMHLLRLDPKGKGLEDMGAIPKVGGGNFCAIATQGDLVIGAQYASGSLWAYDVKAPWNPSGGGREDLGLGATELMGLGKMRDGHFTHLEGLDVLFLRGDKFGAEGTFKISAPADGSYYLYILPLRSGSYATVQFVFDGTEIGEPYVGKSPDTEVGKMVAYGPVELKAGDHELTVRILETEGQESWFSLCSVELTQDKREAAPAAALANPRVLSQWHRDICRPRTALAHSDGKHVMMAGFAGYGLCGGGIGIYNLETDEETLLTADEDLLAGHSTITLKELPNGDLVGGTSISAPGGGHATATEAELYILDWETKKIIFRTVPVPGDGNIVSIQVLADGLVYGLSGNSTFFVFDPDSKDIVHSESFGEYGGVPRHALQVGPDGELYAMLSKAILKITPGTFEHEKLADTPVGISAGGALVDGLLYFGSNSHVWSYDEGKGRGRGTVDAKG